MNRLSAIGRRFVRPCGLGLMAAGACISTGCVGLSLGGKTTYVQDPHAEGRISALEARVSSLEQAMWGSPPQTSSEIVAPPPLGDNTLPEAIAGP